MGNFKHIVINVLLIFSLVFSIFATSVSSESAEENEFYGYIIDVFPEQGFSLQTNITILVNELLHENIPVYWITADTDITTSGLDLSYESIARSFNKGAYLIPFTDSDSKNIKIIAFAHNYFLNYDVEIFKIHDKLENLGVIELVEPKIAHYAGKATFTSHKYILEDGGFQNKKELTPEEVLDELTNENYNVLIWGGGDPVAIVEIRQDILSVQGLQVRNKIRSFVENGGGYTGSCYGGWRAASDMKRPLGYPLYFGTSQLLNFFPMQLNLLNIDVYRALPGAGDVSVKVTNTDHPLTYGLPEIIHNHSYVGGPMFIEKKLFKSDVETIGVLEEVSIDDWDWDSFMTLCPWWSSTFVPEETKMKIARSWMDQSIGQSIWVTGKFGEGKVVAFGGHPEYAGRINWDMGDREMPRTVFNSIFYACSKDPSQINLDKSYSYSTLEVNSGGPYFGIRDESIQLSGSVENGEAPYEWIWEFEIPSKWYVEDYSMENLVYEQNPEFTYYRSGDYKAILVVMDSDGNIGTDTADMKILYSYIQPRIEIHILASDDSVGSEVQFNAYIVDGGIHPFECHWDFGDGEESNDMNPIHIYNKTGEFEVTLEVTDSWGTTVTTTEYVYMYEDSEAKKKSSTSFDNLILILVLTVALIITIAVVILILKRKRF